MHIRVYDIVWISLRSNLDNRYYKNYKFAAQGSIIISSLSNIIIIIFHDLNRIQCKKTIRLNIGEKLELFSDKLIFLNVHTTLKSLVKIILGRY